MERECDICKNIYTAKTADINRGWGLTCSKSCAAKKREKNRENYDVLKVKTNNMKRELWHNKYRNIELKLRKKHKNWSDFEIWAEMYRITNDNIFLSKEARDIFIF